MPSRSFEALQNMERVQRLSDSSRHQAGICKTYQGDKKAGGHTGNPVHQGRADLQGFTNQPGVQLCQTKCQLGWKTSESQQESERKELQRIPDGGLLLEGTGPGLFSRQTASLPKSPLSQEELLRRRRKKRQKRKGFGL